MEKKSISVYTHRFILEVYIHVLYGTPPSNK
jgi:hypothetical protein